MAQEFVYEVISPKKDGILVLKKVDITDCVRAFYTEDEVQAMGRQLDETYKIVSRYYITPANQYNFIGTDPSDGKEVCIILDKNEFGQFIASKFDDPKVKQVPFELMFGDLMMTNGMFDYLGFRYSKSKKAFVRFKPKSKSKSKSTYTKTDLRSIKSNFLRYALGGARFKFGLSKLDLNYNTNDLANNTIMFLKALGVEFDHVQYMKYLRHNEFRFEPFGNCIDAHFLENPLTSEQNLALMKELKDWWDGAKETIPSK